jgi:hypothetical protein
MIPSVEIELYDQMDRLRGRGRDAGTEEEVEIVWQYSRAVV